MMVGASRYTLNRISRSTVFCIAANLLTVYALYFVCRAVFILQNREIFAGTLDIHTLTRLFTGGLLFDTAAISYTNIPWLLMLLLPLHVKETRRWHTAAKWVYVVFNSLCMTMNLCDSVFFGYRGQRTTAAVFNEFGNEGNLAAIIGMEVVSHWYLALLLAVMVFVLARCYRMPSYDNIRPLGRYYIRQSLLLTAGALLIVSGMRGSMFYILTMRPVTMNFAFRYTSDPAQTGIVLNTPFTIIRTTGHNNTAAPRFFATQQELDEVYSPLHTPRTAAVTRDKNVVIIILESFSRRFVGALNRRGGEEPVPQSAGYTPFLDTLVGESLWFDEMIANGFFSIDAPPAILASIPRADRSFVVSPHATNKISAIGSQLKSHGYTTAFFLGAANNSLGIGAFARQAGFDRYYGMDEFLADSRFGGMQEHDGTWGIWDEPFMQYFCTVLGELPQPFAAGLFTITSHHPFNLPEKYRDIYPEEGSFGLFKCLRYTDHALQRFFEEAEKQPWYDNTIFVISADHTSIKAEYGERMDRIRIPILFFDPSGEMPRGRHEGIAQQTDIMPTLLGWLGHDKPYVAFGKDLLSTPAEETWAFNWNSVPMYICGDHIMIFDGQRVSGLYNYREDPQYEHDLSDSLPQLRDEMELRLKAVVQSYCERMNKNRLTAEQTAGDVSR